MEISKKSWHYKLVKFFDLSLFKEDKKISFCEYFWLVVLAVFTVLSIAFLGSMVLFLIGLFILRLVQFCYSNPVYFLTCSLALVIWVLIVGFLFKILIKASDNVGDIFSYLENKIEFYRMLKIRYRAFKEKHCPIVNFKD